MVSDTLRLLLLKGVEHLIVYSKFSFRRDFNTVVTIQ
jgi:hypothetical protein